MDVLHFLYLSAAGILAGIIASIVGGAAVVTYPALIATGLSPQIASVCNLVALMPGTLLAAVADRSQLPPLDRNFVGMVLASVLGAGAGAALLTVTPEKAFSLIVPLLLGFATMLFAFSEPISRWLRARAERQGREIGFSLSNLKMLLPVSFYGGYFGAGVGILLLGVFSVATGGDYRSANVGKNLVTSLNGAAAAAVFMVHGSVVWPQTLALMAGTVIGGYAGSYLSRIIPRRVVRVLIVGVGAALTVSFAWRYWF